MTAKPSPQEDQSPAPPTEAAKVSAKPTAPKRPRKRRTPEEIMERLLGAASEVFAQNGYAGATTSAIARRAGITEAQLFRYFDSKAALFHEAVFKSLNEHFVSFNTRQLGSEQDGVGNRDQARLYIDELSSFLSENAQMLMTLIVAQTYVEGNPQGVAGIDGLREYFERGAAMMARRLSDEAKVAPELMVRVSFAAVLGCVMFKDWIFPPGLATEEDIRAAINDFVIDGINANHDPKL